MAMEQEKPKASRKKAIQPKRIGDTRPRINRKASGEPAKPSEDVREFLAQSQDMPQNVIEFIERAIVEQSRTSNLEDSLQKDNPTIVAKYREANRLTMKEVVGHLQEILTTSLVAYIAGVSTRSVRNWASGSIQSARLDSMEKLRAALTATLILQEAEGPETIANWFINVNSYLDDISPATAIRDGKLREAMKAARVYAAYA